MQELSNVPVMDGCGIRGRPPLGDTARQLVAIRVDAGVLEQFRKDAGRQGRGVTPRSRPSSRYVQVNAPNVDE